MPEITLESLAARVAALEARLLNPPAPAKDWRSVVGMFDDDPGFLDVIAEGRAIREADRAAAREAPDERSSSTPITCPFFKPLVLPAGSVC